jgi:hypothetical protein
VLERLEEDLRAGQARFVKNWSLRAIEQYASGWLDSRLRPTTRARLGSAADHLAASARAFPASEQSDGFSLTGYLYRGSGRNKEAMTVQATGTAQPR